MMCLLFGSVFSVNLFISEVVLVVSDFVFRLIFAFDDIFSGFCF